MTPSLLTRIPQMAQDEEGLQCTMARVEAKPMYLGFFCFNYINLGSWNTAGWQTICKGCHSL